jgi:hypothetical protein
MSYRSTKTPLRFSLNSKMRKTFLRASAFLIALTAAAYGADIGLMPGSRAKLNEALFGQTTWDLVRDCGAVQGGKIDATAAFQYCVNAAQKVGGRVHIPAGSGFKIAGQVKVTSHIFIEGDGPQGDQVNVLAASGYTASVLIATNIHSAIIAIASDESVTLTDFQISYPVAPATSVPSITLDAGTNGGVHINPSSDFRNLHIIGAGIGIETINAETFLFDNLNIQGSAGPALLLQDVNFPGSGDSTVTNSTFSGASSSGAISILSGGGLRLFNNKINMPGPNSCTGSSACIGISIIGVVTTSQGISPLLVDGNSIEGTDYGILFQQTSTEKIGNVVITGNELIGSSAGSAIQVQAHGSAAYVLGMVIAGNFLFQPSTTFISLSCVSTAVIMANTFYGSGTAISLGSFNDHIVGSSTTNSYGAGVT